MSEKTDQKAQPKIPKKPNSTPIKPTIRARKQSPQKSSFWRLALIVCELLIWVAAIIIAVEYAVTFGLYFLLGRDLLMTPVWLTVTNALIYALALFLIIWVPVRFFKKKKLTRKELGLDALPTWADLGLAPVGFFAYLILASILVAIFSSFSFFDAEQAQDLGYQMLNSGFDRIIAFFALCLVAPVAEELIFRGWLYAKLRTKLPGKTLSIILSTLLVSILFGLLHGQWNVGVNVFAMSLVLCSLREITGTVYSGILLHILKNTIAFVLVYIVGLG